MSIVATIANADQFVRMVSGPSGGSWYPLGAKVMQTLESNIKGISTSNTSGGGISNVMSVNGGDAEIGWTYAHTVANGYTGKGKFKKSHKNVRYFATLYPAAFQVVVRADSKQEDLLFAGTERSVYFSVDEGAHWQSLRSNMPATSIRDLVIHDDDLIVGTHGRSIWILDNISPLREIVKAKKESIYLSLIHISEPTRPY